MIGGHVDKVSNHSGMSQGNMVRKLNHQSRLVWGDNDRGLRNGGRLMLKLEMGSSNFRHVTKDSRIHTGQVAQRKVAGESGQGQLPISSGTARIVIPASHASLFCKGHNSVKVRTTTRPRLTASF